MAAAPVLFTIKLSNTRPCVWADGVFKGVDVGAAPTPVQHFRVNASGTQFRTVAQAAADDVDNVIGVMGPTLGHRILNDVAPVLVMVSAG